MHLLKSYQEGYVRKPAEVFTSVQLDTFLREMPTDAKFTKLKAIAVVAFAGGLRCAEVLPINCEDLEHNDLTGFWINYTASKKRRESIVNKFYIPIPYDSYLEAYVKLLDNFKVVYIN